MMEKFVYVAITARIYCRPSCPARHPHRCNALVFPTAEDAEKRGYLPCLRCHPGIESFTPVEIGIKAALGYIDLHLDESITLNALSQVSGLSPNHLHQTFKRMIGLSPKAFCDARRIARFKECLRSGVSISSACYEAGYGSSRALYEKASKGLGMTPSTYQRGSKESSFVTALPPWRRAGCSWPVPVEAFARCCSARTKLFSKTICARNFRKLLSNCIGSYPANGTRRCSAYSAKIRCFQNCRITCASWFFKQKPGAPFNKRYRAGLEVDNSRPTPGQVHFDLHLHIPRGV